MAQITIEVTAQQANRAQAALGAYLNLGRNATGAEVKEWLIRQMRTVVYNHERRLAEAAITSPAPFEPT